MKQGRERMEPRNQRPPCLLSECFAYSALPPLSPIPPAHLTRGHPPPSAQARCSTKTTRASHVGFFFG